MLNTFENKVAVVTGGTGGIGMAIVEKLLHNGATVVVFSTGQKKLDLLIEKYSSFSDKIIPVVCDLSNTDGIADEIKKVYDKTQKIDYLVSNAGVTKDMLSIRMKDEDWDYVMDINLKATFILNREVLKIMSKQKFGSIVNIASILAFTGNAGQANYVASKAGIIGMSKSLAQEVGSRNIRINVIAPGFIVTEMTNVLSDTLKEEILKRIPLKSFGLPEDIANAVVFLCSDNARYITGSVLHVNGGMLMV